MIDLSLTRAALLSGLPAKIIPYLASKKKACTPCRCDGKCRPILNCLGQVVGVRVAHDFAGGNARAVQHGVDKTDAQTGVLYSFREGHYDISVHIGNLFDLASG